MGNGESQVSSVPAEQLDDFIQDNVKPLEDYQTEMDSIVNFICDTLQNPKYFPEVQGVAKGGSYGRKTILRDNADCTLVLFLSHFQHFQDQKESQRNQKVRGLLNKIKRRVDSDFSQSCKIQNFRDKLTIQVSIRKQTVSIEVLPAFNALGFLEKPNPWIYRDLKISLDKTEARPGEFAICFTELQEKFFNNLPRQLKNLILLVKHWHQQCEKKMDYLPKLPLYTLELLTVYAWEQGCGAEDFDIAEGIRTVLKLIKCQKQLCIYWTVNYNFEDEIVRNILLDHIQAERPVIIDPTDPTNDVSGDQRCWQVLKQEAQSWLTSQALDKKLPAPSWNVVPAPLFTTPGHLLDKFIEDFLQLDKIFLYEIEKTIDIICKFLTQNCFQNSPMKIQIVKGGSAAKGTALKTGSDAVLIVFHPSLDSYLSPASKQSKIIKEIQRQLKVCLRKKFEVTFELSEKKSPKAPSFSLKSEVLNESVDFDVLPAFNALGQQTSGFIPSPKVYTELIDMYKSPHIPGGEFSTCFAGLQRNFIASQPAKLKSLICLMKHWYQQCERKQNTKGSLPPKYALELLAVYAWEKGSMMQDFDTAEGFRTVLELVMQYRQLCIFWTVNYNFEDETIRKFLLMQLQKTRPVILDPADPTSDLGGGDRWSWHLLAKEAKEWLFSLCFKDGTGNPVQPWPVPVKVT
ncbi:2'-5'-oligoadenylate synthase 2 [Otolemur garnettii]|uniref:2'-5'-oligoadenylate synthase 2 n=1 Tax=Otolemur garnettii TaxID=30611 RepID=UPI000C7E9A71|nr:2'-5'-oligoadenylate synthase 2 [Otolemur garnettii]XP_023369078.1 2'-5'-oligoadenylate synthase 2 [Otolemur garnettii]